MSQLKELTGYMFLLFNFQRSFVALLRRSFIISKLSNLVNNFFYFFHRSLAATRIIISLYFFNNIAKIVIYYIYHYIFSYILCFSLNIIY